MMATINFTFQGKGGVGKSLISSFLAQYLLSKGVGVACYDTDPVNATFADYRALNVRLIQIMDGNSINTRHFDDLVESLMELPEGAEAVVDNGAATFVPLGSYLAENDVPDFLQANGHRFRINTIVTGGDPHAHTMQGLNTLLRNFSCPIVVWMNHYFGKCEFLDTSLYRDNMDRIEAVVELPDRKKETFGFDINRMLTGKMTFAEVMQNGSFALMAKQRLKTTRDDIFSILENAGF
jgi:hypothetical protein